MIEMKEIEEIEGKSVNYIFTVLRMIFDTID